MANIVANEQKLPSTLSHPPRARVKSSDLLQETYLAEHILPH
jgi:hypothetical protein